LILQIINAQLYRRRCDRSPALHRTADTVRDAWQIDPDIVNTRGGASALGHPVGASGGRILGTLAKVLRERHERWGVAGICIGVGQGLAVVLENLEVGR
jgi:acetyl-CoA acetyltransferase